MARLKYPDVVISALAELHQARAAKNARIPGSARRLRNARKRVRYWERICADIMWETVRPVQS